MRQDRRVVIIGLAVLSAALIGAILLFVVAPDKEPTLIDTIETTAVSAATTSTTEPTTTTTATTEAEPEWDIEVLGPAMVGVGEWVRLTEPPVDPDSECSQGWLGYRGEEGLLHRYENLGGVGHLRLFNGLRGQDAIVESCEESVESVLIQGSPILPRSGIPEWHVFDLGEPYFLEYLSYLGWRGNSFIGLASTGTWDEFVVFDAENAIIKPADGLIGDRVGALEHGYDFVLPTNWVLSSSDESLTTVEIASPSGDVWIRIASLEFAGDPEPFEGYELLSSEETEVVVWTATDPDNLKAKRSSDQPQLEWVFDGPEGTQYVHHREIGTQDLIIEYFISDSASNGDIAIAQLATELVRHYQTGGS